MMTKSISNQDFKVFRNYYSLAEATPLVDLLKSNEIPHQVESGKVDLITSAITGSGIHPDISIKLFPQDFRQVNELIKQQILDTNHDYKDHHFNQLTDDELKEILVKPEEWIEEDTMIAKILLDKRGIHITHVEIAQLRKERFAILRAGKKENPLLLLLYVFLPISAPFIGFSLTAFTIILLLGGFGMGYYYAYSKSTDPDGVTYYTYEARTRFYGKIILGISLIMTIITILLILMDFSLYHFLLYNL